MALKMAATLFVILCYFFSNGVSRILEQHATTSIKTKNGQVYNCVPFHEQIAFSHPSLKFEVASNIVEIQGQNNNNFGLEGDSCPLGTVPILNVMKTSPNLLPLPQPRVKENCHAIVRTRENNAKKFLGTRATIALYKPGVTKYQWSSARMKLSNGDNSIEAGWMVNPEVFKDNEAHLYAKFSVGGKGCINTQCAGFVQVDTKVPLGFIPKTYSQICGDHWTWNITIDKQQDGNWWLSIIAIGDKIPIGYWPKSLFSSALADVASQVEWGGEAYNPGANEPLPDMGSGLKASYNTKIAAYFQQVTVNDGVQNVQPDDTEKDATCVSFYDVLDDGYQGDYWGRLMYYGGRMIMDSTCD